MVGLYRFPALGKLWTISSARGWLIRVLVFRSNHSAQSPAVGEKHLSAASFCSTTLSSSTKFNPDITNDRKDVECLTPTASPDQTNTLSSASFCTPNINPQHRESISASVHGPSRPHSFGTTFEPDPLGSPTYHFRLSTVHPSTDPSSEGCYLTSEIVHRQADDIV